MTSKTSRPLSLPPHLPERSSPSRVRSRKSFQNRKRFSSAAHNPRALDRCGPFRKLSYEKGKRANAKSKPPSLWLSPPVVGRSRHVPSLQHKLRKEAWRRSLRSRRPGSFFDENMGCDRLAPYGAAAGNAPWYATIRGWAAPWVYSLKWQDHSGAAMPCREPPPHMGIGAAIRAIYTDAKRLLRRLIPRIAPCYATKAATTSRECWHGA